MGDPPAAYLAEPTSPGLPATHPRHTWQSRGVVACQIPVGRMTGSLAGKRYSLASGLERRLVAVALRSASRLLKLRAPL